ncbi:hypothetical protein FC62_GL000540 [Amylolactobacillus amylotrophicus DSM 20534]|uniref:Uncharacterized protein n=3 Tax=Amylolactobacillus TaxID=2767876 RepID=A0A0R1YJT5_9LACO|nr:MULTISPECIES: hypothetical protein [Amylolactobacillus]APT18896.1 hypothetical protein LA20533_06385 [Amylolactobacillus amylophilus DSM 20533 = JCM 1125]KRK38848.1 hypothetical protein FC62_GL000540 [Amylolactobacillus amylotrophicus DSM 20534]KRM42509.1 hypothetical protein FD40_GL000300 [Amylolactobacillus amylophilus DSM 20533 = JCM 1125]GED80071.1 hypothetical protein LAM01_05440 [Amylolactobacillus amylophilus]
MEQKKFEKLTFIGKPFLQIAPNDGNGYFAAYQEVEESADFVGLDETNDLERNRAGLVIFGPETFMYWQGMLYKGEADLPKGLMKYELPASNAVVDEKNGNESIFQLPLNLTIPTLLADIKQAGIEVPANLGLSEKPYVLNVLYPDKQKHVTAVYLGDVIEDVND